MKCISSVWESMIWEYGEDEGEEREASLDQKSGKAQSRKNTQGRQEYTAKESTSAGIRARRHHYKTMQH